MFLRNYYNAIARANLGFSAIGSVFGDGSLAIRSTSGSIVSSVDISGSYVVYLFPLMGNINLINTDGYSYMGNIVFGSGNEPVTFDDYCLGTLIHSGLTSNKVSQGNFSYNADEKKYYGQNKYTLSNSSSENITIREYGLGGGVSTGSYSAEPFLYYRELIEPYVLSPQESVNVILKYSYTMPTIDESGNIVAGSQAYGLNIE